MANVYGWRQKMVNGLNLPSIAGVLGFKDFSNQLNNANAGMRNLVSLANNWADKAYQQSNAEKNAEADRAFKEEQDAINRAFQEKQQQEKFEQELGMFNKQQENQLKNEARKFRTSLYDFDNMKLSDKTDTNDLNELKLRNKLQEVKDHPEYFASDEEYRNTINMLTTKADDLMNKNNELKKSNAIDARFKELRDGDFRNAQQLIDWYNDNLDYIETYKPELKSKVQNTLERKKREAQEDAIKWQATLNQATTSNINTKKAISEQNKRVNFNIPSK